MQPAEKLLDLASCGKLQEVVERSGLGGEPSRLGTKRETGGGKVATGDDLGAVTRQVRSSGEEAGQLRSLSLRGTRHMNK